MNLIKEVKLPNYIEKMHNLNKDDLWLYFDYSNENPSENLFNVSVSISFHDIYNIFRSMKENKDSLFFENFDQVR